MKWWVASAFLMSAAVFACSGDTEKSPVLKRAPKYTNDPKAMLGPELPDRQTPKADDGTASVASLGADLPGRAAPDRATVRWLVTPQAVGTLTIGTRIHEPARGFEGSYVTSFYADAQPLEGFALDDPPVLAVVDGGPFPKWGKDHPGGTPNTAMKAGAMKLARAGKLTVSMLATTDPRPRTELGIGVGDDFLTFSKRYPSAPAPSTFPGLWEDPSCVVQLGTLWFFFDRCDTRAQAKIIRIVVRREEPKIEKKKSKPPPPPDPEY